MEIFVRSSKDIQGLCIGVKEHRLSLYMDDIVFVLQNPVKSLVSLNASLSEFGRVLGYKINGDNGL